MRHDPLLTRPDMSVTTDEGDEMQAAVMLQTGTHRDVATNRPRTVLQNVKWYA